MCVERESPQTRVGGGGCAEGRGERERKSVSGGKDKYLSPAPAEGGGVDYLRGGRKKMFFGRGAGGSGCLPRADIRRRRNHEPPKSGIPKGRKKGTPNAFF